MVRHSSSRSLISKKKDVFPGISIAASGNQKFIFARSLYNDRLRKMAMKKAERKFILRGIRPDAQLRHSSVIYTGRADHLTGIFHA
jgi:hypothetical protein